MDCRKQRSARGQVSAESVTSIPYGMQVIVGKHEKNGVSSTPPTGGENDQLLGISKVDKE